MEQLYNRDAIESGRLAQFIIGLDPLAMNPSQLGDYRVLPIVMFNALGFRVFSRVLFAHSSPHSSIIIRSLIRVIFLKATTELLIHIDHRINHRGIFCRYVSRANVRRGLQ